MTPTVTKLPSLAPCVTSSCYQPVLNVLFSTGHSDRYLVPEEWYRVGSRYSPGVPARY